MNYSLIRLSFDSAVHFGPSQSAQSLSTSEDHIAADTLFSALCHTALQLDGPEGLERLCTWVREDSFLLSDTMPWQGEEYYLPKPFVLSDRTREIPASQAKAMKKLPWIPVSGFAEFSESIRGGEPFDPEKYSTSFGFRVSAARAQIWDGDDAEPYRIGMYQFAENSGLYFLAGTRTQEQKEVLRSLVDALGWSGIGGKISTGCGRFHVDCWTDLNTDDDAQSQWLYNALGNQGDQGLLLTSSLPREEELEKALDGASYQVLRRGGFVGSNTYSETPMKKQTQYFLQAGSTIVNRYTGDLYPVGSFGSHPVYRYGKPLFLGVKLT